MLIPLVLLSIGAIFAGFLFKDLFVGHGGENLFWADSIKFLEPSKYRASANMVFASDTLPGITIYPNCLLFIYQK